MAYGTIKVDTITFTDSGVDKSVSISGLVQNPTFSGNITVTGTVSGNTIQGQTISGVTVTGTTANFTSGNFTNISGGSYTITSGVFAAGSAAAPSISFVSDPNTGIYSPGADQVAISTNGVARLTASTTAVSSTLIVDHPLGTVGNPSITFTGDLDTGFWSPAADTLAASTNGAESLRILSDGKVGLGTSAPNQLLHAKKDQAAATFARIDNQSTSSSAYAGVQLGAFGNTWGLAIGSTSANSNALVFVLDPNTSITAGEKMRLDSSGRLGLGTSSPAIRLHVSDTSSTSALFERTGTTGAFIALKDSATQTFIGNTNGVFSIQTPGSSYSDKLVVTSTGLVGIGTSAPDSTLHVAGTLRSTGQTFLGIGEATTLAYIGDPFTTNTKSIFFSRASGVTDIVNIQGLNAGVGLTDIALQASGGRVGIGTTSPGSPLTIESNAGNQVKITYPSVVSYFLNATSGGDFAINKDGTERARIDSSGRLLVGTSSSSSEAKLLVQGGSTGSGAALHLQRNVTTASAGSTIGYLRFANSADNAGATIIAEGDGTWTAGTSHPTRLLLSTTADGASSPTERMRIESTGRTGTYASAADGFQVSSNAAAGTTYANFVGRFDGGAPFGGTVSLQIWNNGNIQNTNNSYGAISDLKLKENIVDANSQWADLKALQVRKYSFKEGQTHTQIGLIAQEAELVSPGLVSESPDRDAEGNDLGTVTKSVNYSVLYMKAVKALQEAMERIETLEAKFAALEGV